MSAAETILKSHDTTAKWDDTTGQYFAQYKDGGYTYKIWLEEETSLGKKMDEVAKQKVAGFAFWNLDASGRRPGLPSRNIVNKE